MSRRSPVLLEGKGFHGRLGDFKRSLKVLSTGDRPVPARFGISKLWEGLNIAWPVFKCSMVTSLW